MRFPLVVNEDLRFGHEWQSWFAMILKTVGSMSRKFERFADEATRTASLWRGDLRL
jgi:hypothetical protein